MLITVLVILEAAWGFRDKAKEGVRVCTGLRGKMCVRVTEWTSVVFPHLGLFFILLLCCFPLSLSVLPSNLYASSSKPNPTLCPPPFTFLPSIRPERVSFTPAGKSVTLCIMELCLCCLNCCYRKEWKKGQSTNLAWGFVCIRLQQGRRCQLWSVRRNKTSWTGDNQEHSMRKM